MFALAAAASVLAACSGGSGRALPTGKVNGPLTKESEARTYSIVIRLPQHRGLDFSHRYVDASGHAELGIKLRGRFRSYWFPAKARITKVDDQLLVNGYGTLFTFARNAVSARDNGTDADLDLEHVETESIPRLAEYVRERLRQKATTRSIRLFNGGGGGDPGCSDCSIDPIDDSELLDVFYPGGHTAAEEAANVCMLTSPPDFFNDDFLAFQNCLASYGFGPLRDFLYIVARQNCRDYQWYSGNFDTVLTAGNNPIAQGATTYAWSYSSLFDDPQSGNGSFVGFSTDPKLFAQFHTLNTRSNGFSQSRYSYYGANGPIGGSFARLARIMLGSSFLGT
jgi:hypothetical protein